MIWRIKILIHLSWEKEKAVTPIVYNICSPLIHFGNLETYLKEVELLNFQNIFIHLVNHFLKSQAENPSLQWNLF